MVRLKELLKEEMDKKKMMHYDKSMLSKMSDSSLMELCKQSGKTAEEAMGMSRDEMIKHLQAYAGVKEAAPAVDDEQESDIQPSQVLYRDEAGNDVSEDKATKKGELYYLNEEHDIVSKEQASVWTITWTDMKTGEFLGDMWGQVVQK